MQLKSQLGVTLMELVVTLALLGTLAAIGTPVLLDNIRVAKNIDAQNTLKSIFLMEKNYFSENNCYYVSSVRTDINQNLFGSTAANKEAPIAGAETNDFDFSIVSTSAVNGCVNAYKAVAVLRKDNKIIFTINEQSVKTGF